MKQTVKEAAREYQSKFEVCNDVVLSVSGAYDNGVHDQSYDSFIAGAAWRINSVWHRADEKPENERAVLAIADDGIPFIGGPDNSEWEEIARNYASPRGRMWTTSCPTLSTRYSKRTRTY